MNKSESDKRKIELAVQAAMANFPENTDLMIMTCGHSPSYRTIISAYSLKAILDE